MADFYFFTDLDSLSQQTHNHEFGSITLEANNSQKIQITSIHSCLPNSKVYALTDGYIMIQPNLNNSSLVNILLKPKTQTLDNVSVEYFIYRGVKKESIFGNSKINLSGNDLCNEINNTIIKLNAKYPATVHEPEEYILAYGDAADTDFSANIFPFNLLPSDLFVDSLLNTKNLKYKPFPIKAGMHIGTFHSEFGIDVVLKKANIKLSEVRKSNNFIVSNNLNGLTGEDFIKNKTEKEQILNYFDICQFYSLVYQKTGIWIKNGSDSEFNLLKNNNEILTVLNKFINNNFLILDIRNEHNNSLNYQDNIVETIKIKKDNNSYSEIAYPDWPLLKVNIQSVSNLYIKIPKSDFVNVRCYFRESNDKSFSFKAINFDSSNYSSELKLKMNKTSSGVTLSGYFNFMFLRELDNDTFPTEWVIKSRSFIDTIFDIEDLIYTDSNLDLQVKGITYFNKRTKWKIHEDNKFAGADTPYIAKVGVAEDQNNIYFFAFSNGDSLTSSSVDIPIITGESGKEKFLEHILFPKLNNSISLYSYKVTQSGQDTYILEDSIKSNYITNSQKLVPNNKEFVLIAIDKQENLQKLKDAYLIFSNNLPKRLVVREIEVQETSTKSHWKADIILIGYGNDSSTNSFKVKEVNTGIKVFYSKKNQGIIGTNLFNQRYFKSVLQRNAENFYGKMFKNIRYSFRNVPDYENGSEIKFTGGRRDIYFKVLGKSQSPSTTSDPDIIKPNMTWYYIELLDDEKDFYYPTNETKKGRKGDRYFISKESTPIIIAKFDAFLEELSSLNRAFDTSTTNGSQNDSLKERITRFRQRGHESNVDLFNDVITTGDTLPGKIYKDEIQYRDDQLISIPVQANSQIVQFTVTNKLQLYRDIEVVEFSNGKLAEIQHLFVGLDVIGRLKENFTVYFGIYPITILNNVHYSLHSGDAGSLPTAVIEMVSEYNEDSKSKVRQAIETLYNQDTVNNKKINPLDNRIYEHFLNTRFADYDMYANLLSFGLFYLMFEGAWEYYHPNPSVSYQLEALFSTFNIDMDTSELDSVRFFYQFFRADLSMEISSISNRSLYLELQENTFEFSKIWRLTEEYDLFISDAEETKLLFYSNKVTQEFINLINSLRDKYM